MTEQIVRDLQRLAAAPVPVALDHDRLRRDGRRRLVRRRAAAGSAAAVVAVAGVAGVGAWASSDRASPGQDGGGSVEVATAAPEPPTTPATPPPPEEPVPTADPPVPPEDQPVATIQESVDEALGDLGFGPSGAASGQGTDGSSQLQTEAVVGGRAGYLAVVVTRADDPDLCATPLHPRGGRDRTCTTGSDGDGAWSVLRWRTSPQGPVSALRVADEDWAVTVATSVGVPPYAVSDVEQAPDELPRGLHSESDQGDVVPPAPRLPEPPLDEAELLALARTVLALDLSQPQ